MEITIDFDSITVGDVETIEEICGRPIRQGDFVNPTGKMLLAMVYVAGRRQNPEFTLDDARAVPITEIKLAGGQENPPTGEDS